MNTAGMMPHERLPFSGIDERPPLHFPKGIRTVVWPVLALEHWDISRPMARMIISPPQGQPMLPDHPNWSWHEYGMRVGFWRIRRLFNKLSVPPTVTLNARCCETYPSVVKACLDSGWELNAHSYDQQPMHKLPDQRETIFRSLDIIEKFSGPRPRGWFGPGLTQDFQTLDHLREAGIEYFGDWACDDEPVNVKTAQPNISTASMASPSIAPRSCPWPITIISRVRRIELPMSREPTSTSWQRKASSPGTAARFSIGLQRHCEAPRSGDEAIQGVTRCPWIASPASRGRNDTDRHHSLTTAPPPALIPPGDPRRNLKQPVLKPRPN
jgi:hypothetical protein